MDKSIINQVTVVSQQGVASYTVGEKVLGRVIDRIDDCSLEYETNLVSEYIAYDVNDNKLKRITNCPVDITYKVVQG